jgi:hypothetical protein
MQEMYTSDPCSQGMCGGHTNPEMAHEEFVGVRHDSIIALKDTIDFFSQGLFLSRKFLQIETP